MNEYNPFHANIKTDLDAPFIFDGDQWKPLRHWTADDFNTWADHEETKLARDRATVMIAKLERANARTVGEMLEHEGRIATNQSTNET